jgi:hypothetical protein
MSRDETTSSSNSNRRDYGLIIAKRSILLSKTYAIIGCGLAVFAIFLANVSAPLSGLNPGGNGSGGINNLGSTSGNISAFYASSSVVSLIAVPLMVFASLSFSMPVQLLYVYDKNNGVLEYFLSLGMDQADVYKGYLKAALILSSVLLSLEIGLNALVGLFLGANRILLVEISVLALAISLAVVSFVTIAMMAFSSLQKQRTGSNQPLGMGLGVLVVIPAYVLPLLIPSRALFIDLVVALVVVVLALVTFLLSSRLIKREKLLP